MSIKVQFQMLLYAEIIWHFQECSDIYFREIFLASIKVMLLDKIKKSLSKVLEL